MGEGYPHSLGTEQQQQLGAVSWHVHHPEYIRAARPRITFLSIPFKETYTHFDWVFTFCVRRMKLCYQF